MSTDQKQSDPKPLSAEEKLEMQEKLALALTTFENLVDFANKPFSRKAILYRRMNYLWNKYEEKINNTTLGSKISSLVEKHPDAAGILADARKHLTQYEYEDQIHALLDSLNGITERLVAAYPAFKITQRQLPDCRPNQNPLTYYEISPLKARSCPPTTYSEERLESLLRSTTQASKYIAYFGAAKMLNKDIYADKHAAVARVYLHQPSYIFSTSPQWQYYVTFYKPLKRRFKKISDLKSRPLLSRQWSPPQR